MDNNLNQKKVNYKMLILFIGLALLAGGIGALLGGNMDNFETLKKPPFSPPAILFPIVWTILYILMGISSYLICSNKTDQKFKNKASFVYILQLIVNSLWSLFFFRLNMLLFSFIWLLLLIILVIMSSFINACKMFLFININSLFNNKNGLFQKKQSIEFYAFLIKIYFVSDEIPPVR